LTQIARARKAQQHFQMPQTKTVGPVHRSFLRQIPLRRRSYIRNHMD
jgi:hypothetical protein